MSYFEDETSFCLFVETSLFQADEILPLEQLFMIRVSLIMPQNVHLEQKSRQNMWPLKSVAKPAMISQNFAAKKRQRRHQ